MVISNARLLAFLPLKCLLMTNTKSINFATNIFQHWTQIRGEGVEEGASREKPAKFDYIEKKNEKPWLESNLERWVTVAGFRPGRGGQGSADRIDVQRWNETARHLVESLESFFFLCHDLPYKYLTNRPNEI